MLVHIACATLTITVKMLWFSETIYYILQIKKKNPLIAGDSTAVLTFLWSLIFFYVIF